MFVEAEAQNVPVPATHVLVPRETIQHMISLLAPPAYELEAQLQSH
jgi:hypothetical protein